MDFRFALPRLPKTLPLLRNRSLFPVTRFVQCLEQFRASDLKTPDHHLAHSLEEFMTKTQIFIAVSLKFGFIEEKGSGWPGSPCVVVPNIRLKKPRPSERIAGGQGIGGNRTMLENPSLKRNSSAFDQVKAICRSARAENEVAFCELNGRCAIGQEFDMMGAHSSEEWMCCDAP